MKELRTKKVLLAFTETELKAIDKLKHAMQLVSRAKVGRADVIVGCVVYSSDKILKNAKP